MKNFMLAVSTAALMAAPASAYAQRPDPAAAAPPPPAVTIGPAIQRIATASAVSVEPIGNIIGVRELKDGRVLLNDGARRRLLLLDTTLTQVEVVLDSLSEVANTYGLRPGALLPYRGDSIMFLDPGSLAIVVLDPAGKPARIRSVWRAQDVNYVSNTFAGFPGIDGKGRIVYRVPARPAPPTVAPPAGVPYFPLEPDSAFLVAVDLDTRRADTIAAVRIPKQEYRMRQTMEGYMMMEYVMNPMPATDDWAVLADGTVAIVRWIDYRVDYIRPDGTRTSSAKLPFDWQRMTDDDKKRMVDSVAVVQRRSAMTQWITQTIRWVNQYNGKYPAGITIPDGFTLPPGFAKDAFLPAGVTFPANYVYACPPGVDPVLPTTPATPGAPPPMPSCMPAPIVMSGGQTPPAPTMRPVFIAAPEDIPDYRPPITNGSVRADMDGNLWIRTVPAKPVPGGLIYDIVDNRGELVTRYQLPPGYTIVGFGKDKVVYLSMRDATGVHLARVRLR